MKDYIYSLILFLCDGIFGYFFQSIGFLLMICATNKLKLKKIKFFSMSIFFGLLTYAIRSISIISTGFHTMLIITSFIFISVFILKTKIFPTVIGVLSSTIIILICEIIVVGGSALMYQSFVFTSDGTIQGDIRKAIYGIPVNVLLILVSYFLYRKRTNPKETEIVGSVSE